jgi:RecA/RadA recombinase
VSPSPPAHSRADADARVEALLRDLGSRLRRGSGEAARQSGGTRQHPTGLASLDALLEGGFPSGRLCEIAGPLSSGRTSIALALLAQATRAGEWTAWVDVADALDPASAEAAGVSLERVLWVRPPGPREALRACARLLEVRGFALIALDLARPAREPERLAAAAWRRLARAAAASGTTLVVLSQQRVTGTASELAIETKRSRAHFSAAPALLEGIEIEACVARQRAGPAQRVASLRLCASSRAA